MTIPADGDAVPHPQSVLCPEARSAVVADVSAALSTFNVLSIAVFIAEMFAIELMIQWFRIEHRC